jgi:hypothetical protein
VALAGTPSGLEVERTVGPERLVLREINERWLRPGVTREQIAAGLRPLLELPVEHVLATHGGPNDRAALERALS